MALFTQRPGFNPRYGASWHGAIKGYAFAEHKGALMSQGYLSCGVCGACHGRATEPHHTRDGGEAHALEILDANVRLMRAVATLKNVSDIVHVHQLAGSNTTSSMKMLLEGDAATAQQAGREGNGLCERCDTGSRNVKTVQATTIDGFMAQQGLRHATLVSIDAEGYDALVLEGMSNALREKRVSLVEFEKHLKGYWAVDHPERRLLGDVIQTLSGYGYECFVQLARKLLPVSGDCWTTELNAISWSNLLCAHEPDVLEVLKSDELTLRHVSELIRGFVDQSVVGHDPHQAIRYATFHNNTAAACWIREVFKLPHGP